MRIICEKCSAEYNLDEKRIPAGGIDLKCPKCLHSFRVTPSSGEDADATAGDASRWFVLRWSGKTYGPFETETAIRMIHEGKIDPTDKVSTDRASWMPVTDVQLFADALDSAGDTVGNNLELPEDLPMLKTDADLPAPKEEADLPAPSTGGGADLPAPAGGEDLPAPAQGPDLPAPAQGPDLPAPAKGPDLPAPKGGFGGGPAGGASPFANPFAPPSSVFAHADVELPAPKATGDLDESILDAPLADPSNDDLNPFAEQESAEQGISEADSPFAARGGGDEALLPEVEELDEHIEDLEDEEGFGDEDGEFGDEDFGEESSPPPVSKKKSKKKPLVAFLGLVMLVGLGLGVTDLGFFGMNAIMGGSDKGSGSGERVMRRRRPKKGKRRAAKGDKKAGADAKKSAKAPKKAEAAKAQAEPTEAPGDDPAEVDSPSAVMARGKIPAREQDPREIPVDSYLGYDWAVQKLERLIAAGEEADANRCRAALARAYQALRFGGGEKWTKKATALLKRAKPAAETLDYKIVGSVINLAKGRVGPAVKEANSLLAKRKAHPELLFIKGEGLRRQGKQKAAKKELLAAIKARKGFQRAIYSLALVYKALDKPKKSAKQLRIVLAGEPSHPGAALALAELLYTAEKYKKALKALEFILSEEHGRRAAPATLRSRAFHWASNILFKQGKGDRAVEALNTALTLDPKNTDAHKSLAEHYDRRRQYKLALKQYETIQSIGRDDADTLVGIIKSQYGMGLAKGTQSQVKMGIERFPKDARFPYYLGQLLEEQEKYTEAKEQFDKALLLDSSFLEPSVRLAKLLAHEGRWAAAQSSIETVLVNNPKSAVLHNGLGEILYGRKQYKIAEREFRKAVKLDPLLFDARFNLARVLRDTGRLEEALQEFLAVRGAGVDNVELHYDLAQTYQILNRLEQAVEEYNIVLSLDDRNATYPYQAGTAYYELGKYDRARAYFLRALQLDSKLHGSHFYIGLTHLNTENYDDAIKRFQVAADEDRTNLKYRYYQAFTFMQQGAVTQAREIFKLLNEELERSPERRAEVPDLFYQQGLLHFRAGKWAQALDYFKQGLGRHERRADPWFKTAECLAELSFYEKAIPLYKEALRRDKKLGPAHHKLALAYLRQKNPEQSRAMDSCRRAIALNAGICDCHLSLAFIERDRRNKKKAVNEFKKYLKICGDKLTEDNRYEIESELKTLEGQTGR